MGLLSSLSRRGATMLAPRIGQVAPGFTDGFLQKVLDRAVRGVGPFDPAAQVAAQALEENGGDVTRAVQALVSSHSRLAATQGFVTNIGGLVTMAVAVPANVTGLTLVQLRLHAALAHLHGRDLSDAGVRSAILVTLLGHGETEALVKKGKLPGNARWLASSGTTAADTPQLVATQVAATLIGQLGGKQLAATVGKRIPLFGGVVGAGTDARSTWKLGHQAAEDLAG
ncbi:MAG: EcsC family protein [Nocardioides sp.]|nr:EcsC family protein [Nocardioides sp.]